MVSRKLRMGLSQSRLAWAKIETLFPEQKGLGGMVQVAECLPSKLKALISNPNPEKKKTSSTLSIVTIISSSNVGHTLCFMLTMKPVQKF
jgi:hypothetical protein